MYQTGVLPQFNDRCWYVVGTSSTLEWYTFTLPKDARFISFFILGAGAAGTAGGSGSSGSSRAGGNSGASGAASTAIYPARTLASTIYISVSKGGSSTNSYIACQASNQTAPLIAAAGTALTTTGGSALTTTSIGLYQRALSYISTAGQPGVMGANTLGPTLDYGIQLSSAGAAGGGVTTGTATAGGGIGTATAGNIFQSGSASTIFVTGGVAGGTLNGANGFDNLSGTKPFGATTTPWFSLGGAGGAAFDTGTGGNGGNGGIGAGGGGGGAGITGGNGGLGGPGFCLIEWW